MRCAIHEQRHRGHLWEVVPISGPFWFIFCFGPVAHKQINSDSIDQLFALHVGAVAAAHVGAVAAAADLPLLWG